MDIKYTAGTWEFLNAAAVNSRQVAPEFNSPVQLLFKDTKYMVRFSWGDLLPAAEDGDLISYVSQPRLSFLHIYPPV